MPLLSLALLGLFLLINLFVSAFLLWLSCKICRVRRGTDTPSAATNSPRDRITFKRALGVVLAFSICANLLGIPLWFARSSQPDNALAFEILVLVVYVCLVLLFMRIVISPTLGRAALVGLLWQVFGAVYAVVFALAIGRMLLHAYIVPTGAMAETLLGYHRNVCCPTCGHVFVINCSTEADPPESRPMPIFACVCPNCGQCIHFDTAPRSYQNEWPDSVLIDDPGLQGGDRFLAGRGLLGPDAIPPRRFDLVIHEFPFQRSHTYIKRLIGLPRETIAIQGGELYLLPADKAVKYDAAEAEQNVQNPFEAKELMHVNDAEAIHRFEQGQFEILRKSPEQILAMRRLVYDNDHPAKGQPPPWKGEQSWSESGNGFRSAAGSAEPVAWLRYRHHLRDMPGRPALIADMMGYNTYRSNGHTPLLGENWVGDLILECEAAVDNPQGELTLDLSHGLDRFQAQWDLRSGTCTLYRFTKDGEQKLESKPTALNKKGSYRLRFANVDRRLVVWVDDKLPFEDGVAYAPPEDLGPRPENDFEPARIGVRDAALSIRKLKLFRDTYYTVGGVKQGLPHEADVLGFDPTDPQTWRDLRSPPMATLYVQPGHYFLLGDNSAESSDSRSWGAVSHRFLLGRAIFVYYPWKRIGPLH